MVSHLPKKTTKKKRDEYKFLVKSRAYIIHRRRRPSYIFFFFLSIFRSFVRSCDVTAEWLRRGPSKQTKTSTHAHDIVYLVHCSFFVVRRVNECVHFDRVYALHAAPTHTSQFSLQFKVSNVRNRATDRKTNRRPFSADASTTNSGRAKISTTKWLISARTQWRSGRIDVHVSAFSRRCKNSATISYLANV